MKNIEPYAITRQAYAARWSMSNRHLVDLIDEGIIPEVSMGKRFRHIPVALADQAMLRYLTGADNQQPSRN